MIKKIALFKRLPMLLWRPKIDEQIVQLKTQEQYPDFKADFDTLERKLMPYFRDLDNKSLRAQNQFRLQQIVLILGGVLATTLGAIQAAYTKERWPGITEAVVAAFLTLVSVFAREFDVQKKYFTDRLKAETLRAEYFLFLGRLGDYGNDADRERNLIRRVADIDSAEE
jgi:hypothetical protein